MNWLLGFLLFLSTTCDLVVAQSLGVLEVWSDIIRILLLSVRSPLALWGTLARLRSRIFPYQCI